MKKKYIQPSAEFEEIEGLCSLLDDGSKMMPEGSGVNANTKPEDMGGSIFDVTVPDPTGTDDDPNG